MRGRARFGLCGVVLCAVAGAAGAAQSDVVERSTALANDGRFAAAWDSAEGAHGPIERSRARTAVRYAAGDLGGALQSAVEGLELDPTQLELLFYATSVALTLGDHARATTYAARFDTAVRENPNVANRAAWDDWAEEFTRRAIEQADLMEAKAGAITRARATVGAALALATALLLLTRR